LQVVVENGLTGCRLAMERKAVTVVVDALRAGANVASMFHYGTEELLVVREVDEAFAERERWPDAILSGERGGPKVPGFDRGNSPLATAPAFSLRHVVFSSSNCSRCCVGVADAPAAFLGSTVNATATAQAVLAACERLGTDQIAFVTAGAVGDEVLVTIEDHLAAGSVMAACEDLGGPLQIANDRAEVCRRLFKGLDQDALTRAFQRSVNGKGLAGLGLGADVEFAARLDVFKEVPRIAERVKLTSGGTGALLLA